MLISIALTVLAVSSLLVLVTIPFQLVSRHRVARFAQQQSLPITVTNGALVIRYLATTRRWRGSGILLSIVAGLGYGLITRNSSPVGVSSVFAGWFVGAVIAEWRVQLQSSSPGRRSASLRPRRSADYLAGPVRLAVAISYGALITLETLAILGDQRRIALSYWLIATLALAGLITAAARQVLTRPQPTAEPAVIAADESIRSRSLHSLSGAAVAIAGYLASGVLALLERGAEAGLIGFALPLLGILIARSTSKVTDTVAQVSA